MDQNTQPQMQSEDQEKEHISFGEQLNLMPAILQKRFFKQIGICVLLSLVCIVFMIYLQNSGISIGFLIVLYLAYTAFSIVWRYNDGKIICKKMAVLKANNLLKQERVLVSLRELDEGGGKTGEVFRLFLNGNKHDLAMISSNVILDVYMDPRNPTEVIAWEITDFTG